MIKLYRLETQVSLDCQCKTEQTDLYVIVSRQVEAQCYEKRNIYNI